MLAGLVNFYHAASERRRVPAPVRWLARASRRIFGDRALRAAQRHPSVATPPYFQAGFRPPAELDALALHLESASPNAARADRWRAWLEAAGAGLDEAGTADPPAQAGPAALPPLPARPRVSICICTLNRARYLARALAGLETLTYPDFEVVVVNGPSADGTAALLARHADRLKIVSFSEAHLARARNVALRHAAGDIVAVLDDDEVPPPHWLEAMIRPYADPAVGATGGYVLIGDGPRFQCRFTVCNRFGEPADFASRTAAGVRPRPGCARYPSVGGNASFRRDLLLALGGYDERFVFMFEDTDICARVVDAGFDLVVVADASVRHALAPGPFRDLKKAPRNVDTGAFSRAYFVCKHYRGGTIDQLFDALERFRYARHQAFLGWRDAGAFTAADVRRLMDDLDTGLRDGLRAGFAPPDRQPAIAPAHTPPPFRPYRCP